MRVLFAALAALVAVLATEAEAQVDAALAERFGQLYAGAINSDAGLDQFLKHDAEPAPERAIRGFFQDQRWITGGGVDFVGARLRTGKPALVEVAVRSRLYGAIQGVELTLSDGPDPRVTYFDLTPAPAWAAPSGEARLSQAALRGRIRGLVDKGCRAGVFSGAVLVAKGETVLVQAACGEASRRYHVANRLTTRFNLGSMDKMFTAVAVMQLAQTGRLSLDDTLDRHLDSAWLDPETARKVTIRQLLTHTGGLSPDIVDLAEKQPRIGFRELNDYRELARSVRTTFPPGSQFEYSNTGMLLLGAVIQQVSGEDYYEYIRKHVTTPAGMAATGSIAADDPIEEVATGHIRFPGAPLGWRENTIRNLLRGIPAGGGYSTVGDMHRFALALQDGRLLPPPVVKTMWADERGYNYGAGFEIGRGAVGLAVGHSGLYGGVSTRLRIYPESGYTVVALANIDRAAPPLVDAIEGELIRAGR